MLKEREAGRLGHVSDFSFRSVLKAYSIFADEQLVPYIPLYRAQIL